MGVTQLVRIRALSLRDELGGAVRGGEQRGAPGALLERLKVIHETISYWLQPPGDDFQLRAAVTEADQVLKLWDEWLATGQLAPELADRPAKPQHERIAAPSVTIPVRFTDGEELRRFYLQDISRGGVFLRARQVLPVLSHVVFDITMPDGHEIKLNGRVVRVVRPEESGPDHPSGMGVEFLDLTQEVKDRIGAYVERLKRRSSVPPTAAVTRTAAASTSVPAHAEAAARTLDQEDDLALVRRLLWLVAEGSVLGRSAEEVFGLPADAPPARQREVFERTRTLLAPERPPPGLGEEETAAVDKILAELESLIEADSE